jgi:hypothetical protein
MSVGFVIFNLHTAIASRPSTSLIFSVEESAMEDKLASVRKEMLALRACAESNAKVLRMAEAKLGIVDHGSTDAERLQKVVYAAAQKPYHHHDDSTNDDEIDPTAPPAPEAHVDGQAALVGSGSDDEAGSEASAPRPYLGQVAARIGLDPSKHSTIPALLSAMGSEDFTQKLNTMGRMLRCEPNVLAILARIASLDLGRGAEGIDPRYNGLNNIPSLIDRGIAYGGTNRMVVVGSLFDEGFGLVSFDQGVHFERQLRFDGKVKDVAHGAGWFVAVGDGGRIWISPNGLGFTKQNSGTEQDLFRVIFYNNQFIVTGDKGTLLVSLDGGINWQLLKLPDGIYSNYKLNSIVCWQNEFVIFGACQKRSNTYPYYPQSIGVLLSSSDNGKSLHLTEIDSDRPFLGVVTYSGNQCIAVSSDRTYGSLDLKSFRCIANSCPWHKEPNVNESLFITYAADRLIVTTESNMYTSTTGGGWDRAPKSPGLFRRVIQDGGTQFAITGENSIITSQDGFRSWETVKESKDGQVFAAIAHSE